MNQLMPFKNNSSQKTFGEAGQRRGRASDGGKGRERGRGREEEREKEGDEKKPKE